MPDDLHFDTLWNGNPRGEDAGSVWIRFEEINHVRLGRIIRPIAVWGKVVPCDTKGRDAAPAPISGMDTVGIVDTHKGHLMALELGGPDVPANIVPQWAGWQSSGRWRQMEKAVKKDAAALPKGSQLLFVCHVVYYGGADARLLSPRRLTYPHGFVVTTEKITHGVASGAIEFRYNSQQQQDKTDDLIALRAMMEAEAPGDPGIAQGMYDDVRVARRKGGMKLVFGNTEGSPHAPVDPPPLRYQIGDTSVTGRLAVSHMAHVPHWMMPTIAILPNTGGPMSDVTSQVKRKAGVDKFGSFDKDDEPKRLAMEPPSQSNTASPPPTSWPPGMPRT